MLIVSDHRGGRSKPNHSGRQLHSSGLNSPFAPSPATLSGDGDEELRDETATATAERATRVRR